jgi:hypothetical protein
MRFVGRARSEPPPLPEAPPEDHGYWSPRLAVIGAVLDAERAPVQDLAIAVIGDQAWVSALCFRDHRYHSSWIPYQTQLRIDPPRRATDADGPVTAQLRRLGGDLDRQPEPVHDPTIIALAEGWVVSRPKARGAGLVSWEIDGA